jgi:hypothetical protein
MAQFFFEVALVFGSLLILLATQIVSALKHRQQMRERDAWINASTGPDPAHLAQRS